MGSIGPFQFCLVVQTRLLVGAPCSDTITSPPGAHWESGLVFDARKQRIDEYNYVVTRTLAPSETLSCVRNTVCACNSVASTATLCACKVHPRQGHHQGWITLQRSLLVHTSSVMSWQMLSSVLENYKPSLNTFNFLRNEDMQVMCSVIQGQALCSKPVVC